jgi:ABC-2 type transport system permease protein
MKYIAILTRHAVATAMRDRTAFLWMVIMPVIFIFIFGSAYRGGSDPTLSRARITIVNHDRGELGLRLLKHLAGANILVDTTLSTATRVLTIPDSFSQCLLHKRKTTLQWHILRDGDMQARATADLAVKKAVYRLLADLTELDMQNRSVTSDGFMALDQRPCLITVASSYAGKAKVIPFGFNQQVPANLVMFCMMSLFIFSGATLVEERSNGMLRRIKTAPLHFHQIFIGRICGVTAVGLLQIGIILLLGRFLFGVNYGSYPLALTAVILVYCVTISAMGVTLGLMIKSEEKLIAVAIIASMTMSALSGCWFPLEITPAWFEFSANFIPAGLAIKALNRLISYGQGWEAIWPYLLGLAGFLTCFTALAGVMLRRSVE